MSEKAWQIDISSGQMIVYAETHDEAVEVAEEALDEIFSFYNIANVSEY